MPVATRTKLVWEGLLFHFLSSHSSMYVARPVIKLPRNKGGLGIPDLGIVATALHLRWTRAFSNTVPRAGTPSPFYAGAASTLACLREANPGLELDSLELHDLVDLLTPDLPANCVRYDLSRHSPNWKLITASFLDAKRATFMYRMARGCLPITFRPFTKIPTRGKCPFCGSREDLVHIFSQCALPAALLQRIASLYGHPRVPFETVRFLHPLPAQAVNQYVLLLVKCSYQVWVARCAAIFGGRQPGLHESLVFAEPTARTGLGAGDICCFTAVMKVEVSAVAYPCFAWARVIQSPCWAPPTRSLSVISILCSATQFVAPNGAPFVRVGHRRLSATGYSLGTSSLCVVTKVAAPNGSPYAVTVQRTTIGLVEPNWGPPVRVGPRRLPAVRYFSATEVAAPNCSPMAESLWRGAVRLATSVWRFAPSGSPLSGQGPECQDGRTDDDGLMSIVELWDKPPPGAASPPI
ncbi:hypothetical protein HPB52_003748 [Rhipicephalus sanguineus]|uniref:Reverse transcriptase zinc-binding domain-containing protein n=1 Tax=Rhipicephalus sanguineus TaxID=34632 RepID=A0A9D4SVK1_RHISA|nr:hypothetical protein HPB52_003748 [Rhipicephalus sanguineus]